MKKFTKCLAVLSSAVMALSVGVMKTSAAFESKTYDTVYTYENGSVEPIRVFENVVYSGIVVTMPDGSEPTAEEIGVDCLITKYEVVNYGMISDFAGENGGWLYEETVAPEENQYVLEVDDIMGEDKAVEFAEKLVIRGIVEKADILYHHYISNGYITMDAKHMNRIFISFTDEEARADFSFDKYPEIQETLRYTDYDSSIGTNAVTVYGLVDTSLYYTENLGSMEIYNDVKALNDILTEKYDEIEGTDVSFTYQTSADESSAVYSVEPTWGDATNDDVINLYDAIEISKYIMNISDMDEDTILLADINRDGRTDLYDAIEVAKTLL